MGFLPLGKRAIWFLLFLLVIGCGGDRPDDGYLGEAVGTGADALASQARSTIETWTLSDAPLLEIGVREGDEPYQLHRAQSSVLLEDGRIVVANAGTQELRFFDSAGRFRMKVGGDGEGPGEFRFPTRVRKVGKDSLMVWDQRLQRISYLDFQGKYLGSERLIPTSDQMFPGDEWLSGRFWVDSPIRATAREPIRRALDRIPLPDSLPGFLSMKVTGQGRIWASAVRPPTDEPIPWVVYDLEGRVVARVTTPVRFEPHEMGPDFVLGRYLDEMDINYIRLYRLEKPEGSPPGPGLDLSSPAAVPPPPSVHTLQEAEVLAPVKSLVKTLASLEEIHYADHYSYTTDLESLFSDPRARIPDGLEVTILFATPEGWMGTVTDVDSGKYCALAYGFYIPMGWSPGELICP